MMEVTRLGLDREGEIATAMADAFRDYPVMRFVVGPAADPADYDRRLRRLVGFFVARRLRMCGPGLGIVERGEVVAAAVFTRPDEPEMTAEVLAMREAVWQDLGLATRRRHEAYAEATRAFAIDAPHHHLNMVGVRASHQGRGLARPLLEAMRRLAEDDPGSAGVSLTTEVSRNVTLYHHFGYETVGHVRVAPDLESWGLFHRVRD
ncbi:MAG TPA: GNAT family N-acetyltransferase [Vicinamibacterales bacterium]|nr:GNAT family N-acetyltransferase [Vicinamibacterales bacterium]